MCRDPVLLVGASVTSYTTASMSVTFRHLAAEAPELQKYELIIGGPFPDQRQESACQRDVQGKDDLPAGAGVAAWGAAGLPTQRGILLGGLLLQSLV